MVQIVLFQKMNFLLYPSTGEEISKVVLSSELDFNKAIESSRNALPIWSNTTPLKI